MNLTFVTRTVDLNLIDMNAVQPGNRTTKSALKGLKATVNETGFILPLILVPVGSRYVLADGHRRFAVLAEQGITRAVAHVFPAGTDPTELFVRLNKDGKAFKGRDWLQIYATDPKLLDTFSPKMRADILMLQGWIGQREVVRIGAIGHQSPVVIKHVVRLLGVLNSYASTANQTDGAKTFYWLKDNEQQRAITEFLKGKKMPTQAQAMRLLKAITSNTPLPERTHV